VPRQDDTISALALQAVYEYWVSDGHNESVGGVAMIEPAFMSAWNWDARPFPIFPQLTGVWGDAGNWPAGNWLGGKGPFLSQLMPSNPPAPGPYATFLAVPTLGWSVTLSPIFSTATGLHVSGREVRAAKYVSPLWAIELNYDLLRMVSPNTELQEIVGFFEECGGEATSFYFEPPMLSPAWTQALGAGDGTTSTFAFAMAIGGAAVMPANVGTVSAVYLDGVAQSTDFLVNATALAPSVTFATAPAAGVAVTADFRWYFICRFDDDSADTEEFMAALYALQSLRLRTVRS
jgi:uncharacterized protein (TIGR02217 family)